MTLDAALCWCAIQEQKIRDLEFRVESVESSCMTQNDVNRYMYHDIEVMCNAHNSACKMIDMLLANAGFEVQKDE